MGLNCILSLGYERLADEQQEVEAPVILLNEGEMIDSEESGDESRDVVPPLDDVTPGPVTSHEDSTEIADEALDGHVSALFASN